MECNYVQVISDQWSYHTMITINLLVAPLTFANHSR